MLAQAEKELGVKQRKVDALENYIEDLEEKLRSEGGPVDEEWFAKVKASLNFEKKKIASAQKQIDEHRNTDASVVDSSVVETED